MRPTPALSVLVAPGVALLLACAEAPTAPVSPPEVALDASTEAPLTVSSDDMGVLANLKVPFSQIAFVPCANEGSGEDVYIEGLLHIIVKLGATHYQPMGATGVGLSTGDIYRATGVTRESTWTGEGGFPFVNTRVNNFFLVGPGTGNNYRVHETIHFTFNANGEPTAEVANINVTCD